MHFSPVLAFPSLALSPSLLSNIRNHWALQRTASNPSQAAGVRLGVEGAVGVTVNTCAPECGCRGATLAHTDTLDGVRVRMCVSRSYVCILSVLECGSPV